MDWNVVAAVSQLVGTVGVVASLAFVGRQVRLSNSLARAEAYRVVSLRASEMVSTWAADNDFLHVVRVGILEGRARLTDLSEDEQTKAILYYAAAIRVFETIHRQVESGVIGSDAYEMLGGRMFNTPLFEDVWARLRGSFSTDFASLIERHFSVLGPTQ